VLLLTSTAAAAAAAAAALWLMALLTRQRRQCDLSFNICCRFRGSLEIICPVALSVQILPAI